MNKRTRGQMNMELVKALHEIEAYLRKFQKYIALSIAEILATVSLIANMYQFCKFLTIKERLTYIGMTYVKAGIIYQ